MTGRRRTDPARPVLDHLVLAAPALDRAVADLTAVTGRAPATGGSHVDRGTANFLIGLGAAAYLEIIGPDPGQPDPPGPRPFGVDEVPAPQLVTWAIRTTDLDAAVATARAAGYDPGEPAGMARRTPDGQLLRWRLTPPQFEIGDGLVPFLIDWGATLHPTARGLPQLELLSLSATHPDPDLVRGALTAVGAELDIEPADDVRLEAVVRGPLGDVPL